ncbi:MAG: ABC transporter substrate-binding protein [Roseibium sp.]|uniref:ABC transporter substrate-binding protein n=1 Tax=Roseibium sp. TaxID=1936156 RepID=UPI0026160F5E|nr:ABC transporter substrate-binding protein [Roseibium sp.]MCV0426612.1 ABC transporter substrate-binding protein [Roseibium sp.]
MRRLFTHAVLGAAVAVAVLAPFNAGALERGPDGLVMVVAGRQPVATLDPSVKYDASTRTVQQALYDALVKYENNPPEISAWLAESWETSPDGLVWTFKLSPEAKFHNGDPVDAEAVRFSFERTLKLNQGPAWMLSSFLQPENIKALDDHTVQFTLDRPYAPFLSFLPWWYVMNPKQVQANEVDGDMGQAWLASNDAGSGPYKIKRFEQGDIYELERNANYWRGFPYDDENGPASIIYQLIRETAAQRSALSTGDADIVLSLSPDEFDAVASAPGIETSTQPALTAFGIKFNTKGEFTADENLRKAIAHAFDYEGLVKIYNGKAKLQTSPFADAIDSKIEVEAMPRQDLEKAKEFLSKSNWPDGGITLEFVHVQGNEEQRLMGLILIDSLQDLGIEVEMVPLTWPNMVAKGSDVKTSPDMMAIFATPVSTDADAVAFQYHPDSWGKYYGSSFYDNPEVASLIEKARFETDAERRSELYAEIQKRIVADQPEIFGMMRERRIAFRDYVGGFSYSPVRMTTEIDLYPLHIEK